MIPELFVAENRGAGFVDPPIIMAVNDVTRVHEFLTSRQSERPFRFYFQSEHNDENRAKKKGTVYEFSERTILRGCVLSLLLEEC